MTAKTKRHVTAYGFVEIVSYLLALNSIGLTVFVGRYDVAAWSMAAAAWAMLAVVLEKLRSGK